MRRSTACLIAALTVLGVGGCSGGGGDTSAGSCRPPRPIVVPTEVSPGDSLDVTIEYPLTCQDGNSPVQAPDTGWRGVRVVLVQGGAERLLTTADADGLGRVRVSVRIPTDVSAGQAIIRADSTEDAVLLIK